MPLFFQHDITPATRLAIWKIEEEESFFSQAVPLQREITHQHKRRQHLAGRYLLRYLFPEFPLDLIRIADTRKPFLEDEAFHFSISHCADYAGVIVSRQQRVGIDLEIRSEKVQRIRHKFISPEDERVLGREEEAIGQATLVWSCKEAVFKWFGRGGVDFREHIRLQSVDRHAENRFESSILFLKDKPVPLTLHSRFFGALCLSYVAT